MILTVWSLDQHLHHHVGSKPDGSIQSETWITESSDLHLTRSLGDSDAHSILRTTVLLGR